MRTKVVVKLADVALVNPKLTLRPSSGEKVSFVPMAAVDAVSGTIADRDVREFGQVRKGYTLFEDGDLLLAKITPCFENGKIARASLRHPVGAGSTEFHVIRPDKSRIDGRYLLYLLRQPRIRLLGERRMTGSAGQRRVPETFIADIDVPLPSVGEQRRVVEALDRADGLRVKRCEALAMLDDLLQSIFLSMFGDPVVNERGWVQVQLSDFVARFDSGKNVVAEDLEDLAAKYRVLKVSAVTSLEFRESESKAAPPDYSPPYSHFVREGDLLFSRANTSDLIGATALVGDVADNILLPDKLWRFVWHDSPKACPMFVRQLFRQPTMRRAISRRATGTSGSMKNISQEKVFAITTGLPPIVLQEDFGQRVTKIEQLRKSYRTSLAELDALFASVQDRAFRGEL